MGILVITWNFPPRRGGIEYLIENICAGLKQRHSVTVITRHCPSALRENAVFRAPWPGLIAFGLYALWRGARLLRRDPGRQIIFGGSAMVAPVVLILARLFGRKAIVQTHGLDIIYANIVYQLLCVRWLKRCERVIANSTYTAFLLEQTGVPAKRIEIIPPGIDPRRFANPTHELLTRANLGLEGKKIILFVGRLVRRKGIKEFIEKSFVNIVQAIPEVCFIIAGDNPVESLTHRENVLGELKEAIAHLRLQDHVQIIGAVSDEQLTDLYQLCDVVVLPVLPVKDDVEGFGIVLIEAAAAAKPVVATRVGGIPDAVEDGKSGILVEPGDYNRISQCLIALLTNDRTKSLLGGYAQRRAAEKFGWQRIVERHEAVLHALSGESCGHADKRPGSAE